MWGVFFQQTNEFFLTLSIYQGKHFIGQIPLYIDMCSPTWMYEEVNFTGSKKHLNKVS